MNPPASRAARPGEGLAARATFRRTLAAALLLSAAAATARGESPRAGASTAPETAAVDTAARAAGAADTVPDAPVPELPEPDTAAAAALIQAAETAAPETVAAEPPSAPVFLGGREIFRVRAARDGLAPAERAAAIRRRINLAVGDARVPVDSVRLVATPEGIEVRLGPHFLWLVTPGDADVTDPSAVAERLGALPLEVGEGIERERASRRPLRLLFSAGVALVLTVAALALLRLLALSGARWRRWLDRSLAGKLPAIRLRSFEVLSQAQVAGITTAILGRLDVVAVLFIAYWYLTAVFSLFPWTQGWGWLLFNFATRETLNVLRSLSGAVPGLAVIAFIILLFRWLIKLSDRFFDALAGGAVAFAGFHPELARPSKRITRIVLWIVAVMVAYPYIPGSQSRAVQGVSILLGVMVSLGSTGFVGNMIAGLVLTYARSFRVGERVRIGEHVGDVVSLGFFATKLRSIHNEEVTLPNGQVAGGPIVNYSRLADERGLALHTEVTIGYDVEWRKVHALLIEAAGRVPGIERDPAPSVYQRSLNDHHVSYELSCITRDAHAQRRLYSDLHAEIQDAFNRAGVEILSPGYHAVRDANAAVLPVEPKGPRPGPGGFRVSRTEPPGA